MSLSALPLLLHLVTAQASLDVREDPSTDVPRASRRRLPLESELPDVLDLVQASIGNWQRERQDFFRDAAWLRAYRHRRQEDPAFANVKPEERAPEARPGWMDSEMERIEAEQEARDRRRAEDPAGFAKEEAERVDLERAWQEAVHAKEQQRQLEWEAEGARIQSQLDEARRQEAQRRARRLGGKLDASGNFVDPDLKQERK